MEQDLNIARRYLPACASGKPTDLISGPTLKIASSGPLDVVYAPFDYVERKARLVIVGITPGMTQAINAISAAQTALRSGLDIESALRQAKLTGSFSGPLRANHVAMLDAIGVAKHLEVQSTFSLFAPGSTDIHFTSALRYPVLLDGKNYSGTPDMLRTPLLREMIDAHLVEEARLLPQALWLPLGPKADAAVQHLAKLNLLDPARILSGLPHPSGANAERVAVFLGRKAPELASRKTNPQILLQAFKRLAGQIANLKGKPA